MDDRLRAFWDFDDLDSTEARFLSLLENTDSPEDRAEILTQLARVDGLRGDFESGESRVDDASALAGETGLARARVDLERGRLRRSSGNPELALGLFESAFAHALDAEQDFVAADAAHMAALAASSRNGFVLWTRRGIELAETRNGAAYWLGPLLNNLGWEHFEAGELELALDAFQHALAARERDPENAAALQLARYAVGKTLRRLGRVDDAIPLLEQAVAWAAGEAKPDGWFHEELAEEYAALGRSDDARVQACLAIPLLERDDPSFAKDEERRRRLLKLSTTN